MREYYSEGIVLDVEPSGEMDLRASVYTKHFGRLTGKLKSARKITSKLAGHVQPGNLIRVRFVEKRGLQLVEALKAGRTAHSRPNLYFLNRLLPDEMPDEAFWNFLALTKEFRWNDALPFLGWDATHGTCELCEVPKPELFSIEGQFFVCKNCYAVSHKKGAVVELA